MTKSNTINSKSYDELTIADDFMFYKVMSDEELCKELLETILDIKIEKLVYHETQAVLKDSYDGKGIRLDIYAADENKNVYNIEMQALDTGDLEKRSRYYQSCIDMDLLDKGVRYKHLSKSMVIFICTFDIFKKDLLKYTFTSRCNEDKDIVLDDGLTKVFVNAAYTGNDLTSNNKKLLNLIKYISTGIVTDEYTKKLNDAVISSRKRKSWRNEYMKYRADREDLLDIGMELGLERGIEQGREQERLKVIEKMLLLGMPYEEISAIIDISLEELQSYVDIE